MKKRNKNLLTLILAGTLCAATIGGVAGFTPAKADETPVVGTKYTLTSLFVKENEATVKGETVGEKTTLTFTKKENSAVKLNRDLALKWFDETGAPQYASLKFAFADMNFSEVSIVIKTTPFVATESGVAENVIKFTNASGVVSVQVNDGAPTEIAMTNNEVAVSLGAGVNDGEFAVTVNEVSAGNFINVGANYAAKGDSLAFKATPTADTTSISLHEINGQSFEIAESGKIADNAKPVLVIDEEIKGLLLGTKFDLTYKAIDVAKDSVTVVDKFYQYNPADTEIVENDINVTSSTSTSTYFVDTVYYIDKNGNATKDAKDGDGNANTATSVYKENNEEYVSITYELSDGTYTSGKDNAPKYELAWYTDNAYVASKEVVAGEPKDYIILNRNDVGPKYIHIEPIAPSNPEEEGKNKVNDEMAFENARKVFVEGIEVDKNQNGQIEKDEIIVKGLNHLAGEIYAGTGATLTVPAMNQMIVDPNNDYKTLRFTVSYKTPTSSSPSTSSTSNKLAKDLKIPTTSEGTYEFKIFAVDAIGNAMKYYLDGELVEVTSSNVWDIEEIPAFKFTVANKGLGIPMSENDSTSDVLDKKNLNDSYTMTAVKVYGASKQGSSYALYKVDESLWKNSDALDDVFAKIKYHYEPDDKKNESNDLNEKVKEILSDEAYKDKPISEVDYLTVYKDAYVQLIAGLLEKDVADVEAGFTKINEYDSRLDADEGDNVYNWNASSRRFTCYEEGLYVIVADYWDTELVSDRVAAYQLVQVRNDTLDEIGGESNWWKNNWVSVMLFSIAGVLGIAIIVLIFVKPSDEKLEDVDKKGGKTVRVWNKKNK